MFEKYLAEAKKVYEFKIGVAGDMSEDFTDMLEGCLQRYSIASMSPGKKTPIQERPLDFPKLQNTEVTHYEVALNYPTTPQVLGEYIAQCCNCSPANIIVRSVNDPIEAYQEPKDDAPYEARLTKEEMEQADPKAQDHVGANRVMGLLQELEVARKSNEYSPIADVKAGNTTDITDTEGTMSPVGSK
jgi:hypothetical protein